MEDKVYTGKVLKVKKHEIYAFTSSYLKLVLKYVSLQSFLWNAGLFYIHLNLERERDRETDSHAHKDITLSSSPGWVLSSSVAWVAGCATFRVTSATKALKTVYHLGNPGIFRGQGSSAIFMASRLQKIVTLKSLENLLSMEVKLHSLSFCRKGQGQWHNFM